MKYSLLLAAGLGVSTLSNAATIAVIDSGLDTQHDMIQSRLWFNPMEIEANEIDEDYNGFVDDIHGWNFAENSNQLIDYQYQYTYTPEVKRFFATQTKLMSGTATDEDKAWYRAMTQDSEFMKTLSIFGNYAHGTHVAGISLSDNEKAEVLGIKLIPTKSPLQQIKADILEAQAEGQKVNFILEQIVKFGLKALAGQQAKVLLGIGEYLASEKVDVINCSFGIGTAQAEMFIRPILKLALINKEPNQNLVDEYTAFFVNQVVQEQMHFVKMNPEMIFVFAAGNDGKDNSIHPIAPANIKRHNTITVAATFKDGTIAPFSNYSRTLVDIAAPGVGIESSVPGGDTMQMSGTSQAAPYITGVVAKLVDAYPNLTNIQIKEILFGTVDKLEKLDGKVRTGGLVNVERALSAAAMVSSKGMKAAIKEANFSVANLVSDEEQSFVQPEKVDVQSLPFFL